MEGQTHANGGSYSNAIIKVLGSSTMSAPYGWILTARCTEGFGIPTEARFIGRYTMDPHVLAKAEEDGRVLEWKAGDTVVIAGDGIQDPTGLGPAAFRLWIDPDGIPMLLPFGHELVWEPKWTRITPA